MAEATLAISFAPLGAGVRTDTVDLDRLEREDVAAPPTRWSRRVRSFVLCGPPLPGTELEIGDSAGDALPERRVGRILVRGPGLMRGYDGRPAETAAVMSPDGWLDTGDLGYRLGREVVVTGRAKDLIIVNGRNVWPQDLEWSVEQSVPALRSGDVAAFSVEEDETETVVLLVETRGAPNPRAREALAAEVAGTLRARHGLEGRVVLVPPGSLPHTSSGKLSRVLARARYLQGDLAPIAAAAQ
jgi:fatty-acyl-CoA synthase